MLYDSTKDFVICIFSSCCNECVYKLPTVDDGKEVQRKQGNSCTDFTEVSLRVICKNKNWQSTILPDFLREEKKMKKSLVLAMAMALGVTASAYAANPFSDVPAGHWAYDSINKLAAAGVVEGYGDTTFGGDKLMTRYEMAQIVAKAMAKGANVDKLAAEFADELDNLGVRVANLEKKADNVKITGEVRYHYTDTNNDFNSYKTALRSRIWVNGQINEDWTYTGMLENSQDLKNNAGDETTKFQRAYVNGRVGGLAVQAGRYNKALAEGNVYDNRFDGIQASYGSDVKLTAGYGKATPSAVATTTANVRFDNFFSSNSSFTVKNDSNEVYYAELTGKVGALNLTAGYYEFKDIEADAHAEAWGFDYMGRPVHLGDKDVHFAEDATIWALGANYAFDKNFKLGALYLKGEDKLATASVDDDGYVVTASYKGAKAVEPGSWGLVAKYYDQGATTYVHHTMNGVANDMFGFKGYSVAANYAFAKNIVGQVEYYDLEEKEGNREAQTLWSQLVFTF